MNKKITGHVNELFAEAPQNPQVMGIKEELLADLQEKYLDLLQSGKSEDDAYATVVAGIGDIGELLGDLAQGEAAAPQELEKKRALRNLLLSAGVAIYVLSLSMLLLFEWMGAEEIGLVAMLVCCAIATGMVVYAVNMVKAPYRKRDDTFVEQYREKLAEGEKLANLRKAISSAFWPSVAVIYLAVSFLTNAWGYTWIIFVVASALHQLLMLRFVSSEKEKRKLWHGMFWCFVVAVYLIINFAFGVWGWSWIVFPAAAAIQQILKLMAMWRDEA